MSVPFELAESGEIRLTLVDQTGREVRRLSQETDTRGRHAMIFDVSDLPAGAYRRVLVANGSVASTLVHVVR